MTIGPGPPALKLRGGLEKDDSPGGADLADAPGKDDAQVHDLLGGVAGGGVAMRYFPGETWLKWPLIRDQVGSAK